MEYLSRDPDNYLLFTKLIAGLLFSLLAVDSRAENPLEPLDASSPQATFESFLVNIDDVARRYFEYRDAPSRATYDSFSGPRPRVRVCLI